MRSERTEHQHLEMGLLQQRAPRGRGRLFITDHVEIAVVQLGHAAVDLSAR